jgi:hypothetical protein
MKIKNLLVIGAVLITINACKKEKEIIVPVIPPAEVDYNSTDSMKLDSSYINLYGINFYNQINNKQYIIKRKKAEMSFENKIINNKFIIFIIEKSNPNQKTEMVISFNNKDINNISGTYSLTSNDICIEWTQFQENISTGQFISIGTEFACDQIIGGNITIVYDAATKTISGKIEKLKYPFGLYLPIYLTDYNARLALLGRLEASGSNRNQDIFFTYVRQR